MLSRFTVRMTLAMAALVMAAGCDSVPLLAPTDSIITVTSATRTLAPGGSTDVTAFVIEQAGTPVHNGTVVRFTATLGQVNPIEVETVNGIAITSFTAGAASGTARIRATSGAATGGDGDPPANVVEIQIGGAAAGAVSLSASPARVPSGGGTVAITAAVLDAAGNRLPGVPVTFSTTGGTLSATSALTDSNGDAHVSLTTNREARVTARAGDKTSDFTVTVGTSVSVSLSTAPTSPTAGQPVTLTVTPASGQAPRVVVQWGDGSQSDLGTVSGARTATHSYTTSGTFTITAFATLDGEATSSSTTISVNAPGAVGVNVSSSPANPGQCQAVTFTASVSPTGESISFFEWEIVSNVSSEDQVVRTTGNQYTRIFPQSGTKRIKVVATTPDGRQGSGLTQVFIQPVTPTPSC